MLQLSLEHPIKPVTTREGGEVPITKEAQELGWMTLRFHVTWPACEQDSKFSGSAVRRPLRTFSCDSPSGWLFTWVQLPHRTWFPQAFPFLTLPTSQDPDFTLPWPPGAIGKSWVLFLSMGHTQGKASFAHWLSSEATLTRSFCPQGVGLEAGTKAVKQVDDLALSQAVQRPAPKEPHPQGHLLGSFAGPSSHEVRTSPHLKGPRSAKHLGDPQVWCPPG